MYPLELAEQFIIDGSSALENCSKEESNIMIVHTYTHAQGYIITSTMEVEK